MVIEEAGKELCACLMRLAHHVGWELDTRHVTLEEVVLGHHIVHQIVVHGIEGKQHLLLVLVATPLVLVFLFLFVLLPIMPCFL